MCSVKILKKIIIKYYKKIKGSMHFLSSAKRCKVSSVGSCLTWWSWIHKVIMCFLTSDFIPFQRTVVEKKIDSKHLFRSLIFHCYSKPLLFTLHVKNTNNNNIKIIQCVLPNQLVYRGSSFLMSFASFFSSAYIIVCYPRCSQKLKNQKDKSICKSSFAS